MQRRFDPLRELFAAKLESGEDLGASLALNIDGEMVVDLWGGWADLARTVPWTENTITNVFSTIGPTTPKSIAPISLRSIRRTRTPERSAKLPGPPARTLKLEKPGWRPRSASAVGSARCATPVRVGAAPIARIGCPPGRSPSRTGHSRSPRLGRLPAPRQLGVGPTWRRGSGRDN